MKKIPYGVSNFKMLMDKNMYYIDKTKYLENLEAKDEYQFFIRPRRFGKSLFLSMMETYYDINEKVNFEKYFGNLYIGNNKTPDANSYVILKFSFTKIITDLAKEDLIESFDYTISTGVELCIRKYYDIFGIKEFPKDIKRATYALEYLIKEAQLRSVKILLLIDEYDNFVNNIMSKNRRLYDDLVHEDGYVRTFYKAIKDGTADGVINRTFITGVSPIMLDDVTSGANIFTISSNDKDLNCILGITEEEVNALINYYKLDSIIKKEELLNIFKDYCNGYKFNEEVTETVYNTDMVLFIVNNIVQKQEYPKKLIDENVKTDYGRLRNIAEYFITKEEMLKMLEEGQIGPVEIKDRFNLESLYRGDDKITYIRSLLYYLGMFTIGKNYGNKVMLKVPNYTVKSLYWEYMSSIYEINQAARYEDLARAMESMRMQGNIEDIMTIYTSVINRLSSRDLSFFNEASCKSIFITLAYTDGIYLIASEREANGGYSDLYLKENVIYKEHVKYRYMIEFKHIKVDDLKGNINKLPYAEFITLNKDIILEKQKEAELQLNNYMQEHNIINDSDRILKKFIVITLGRKYVEYFNK